MQVIDFHGNLDDYLLDDRRKISKAHLDSVCKFQQGKKTCRYIMLSTNGYVCVKKTIVRTTLDERAKQNKMTAQADNCEGLGTYKK